MSHNVHHIHNKINRQCASVDIFVPEIPRYNVRMAHKHKKTFLREWRNHSGKTLVQVGELLHMSHSQLSRIERGDQPYNQELLEALAELYMCDPVDLLIRDPSEPSNIWSLWEHASKGDRQKIYSIAETIIDKDSDAA